MAEIQCEECGGPVGDNGIRVGFRGGMAAVWLYVCGIGCQERQTQREADRRPCAGYECNRRFTPSAGPGRPQIYCDDGCRKRTDKALRRAQVLVARGKIPRESAKIEDILSHVVFLQACWLRERAAVRYGRPFPQLDPKPDRQLIEATGRYVDRLRRKLPDREREERLKAHQDRATAAAKAVDEHRKGQRQIDNAWRLKVLENLAAEAQELDDLGVY